MTPDSSGCVHDPGGVFRRCYLCNSVQRTGEDDDKAYLGTAAWLQFKSGMKEHDREAELLILTELFTFPDERTQL